MSSEWFICGYLVIGAIVAIVRDRFDVIDEHPDDRALGAMATLAFWPLMVIFGAATLARKAVFYVLAAFNGSERQ